MKKWILGLALLQGLLPAADLQADSLITGEDITISAPRVRKRDISLKPEALPANVSVVTGEDVKTEQVNHYLDMLRQVPGIGLSTYGQGGIGDGIGMRGFFSDHGSQTAFYVDGVPLNWANNNHANGLTDLSWLTPEMIDRIEVIKGPFSALYGGFAMGGVINIVTKKTDSSSQISGYGGSYGTCRGAAELTKDFSSGVTPLLIAEGFHQDGYRQNSDWSRINSFNKVTLPVPAGLLSLRGGIVKQDWDAPGYISLDQVRQGTIDRSSAISSADGGFSRNYNFVANFDPKGGEAGFQGTAFVSREQLNRFNTKWSGTNTQGWGLNERTRTGWRGLYSYQPLTSIALALGTEGQYEDGRATDYQTVSRQITGTSDDYGFHQWTGALFSQLQMKPLAWFGGTLPTDLIKLVGGARYDAFDITLQNRTISDPRFSGTDRTSIVSPKGGIVISPLQTLDIFANKGTGFRQPAIEEISPSDATQTPNFNLSPSKIRSWDVGFNQRLEDNRIRLAFDYYESRLDREIVVVNDQPVNIDNTERNGFETSAAFDVTKRLTVTTAYAWVKARDLTPDLNGGDQIPMLPKSVWTNTIRWTQPLSDTRYLLTDLSSQLYGRAPLTADDSVHQPPATRWEGRFTYGQRPWEAFIGASFIPQQFAATLELFHAGQTFYNPEPRWMVTTGARYYFKI
jgi:outer membrane receptor protein involved in Fe transport